MLLKSRPGSSGSAKSSSRTEPQSPLPPVDEQEQDFWNTPGAGARTLHFTGDLLKDEQIDMSELSRSLESPAPAASKPRSTSSRPLQFTTRTRETSATPEPIKRPPVQREQVPEESQVESPDVEDNEDITVMLQKPPSVEGSGGRRSAALSPLSAEPPQASATTPRDSSRPGRMKVTRELENIAVSCLMKLRFSEILTNPSDEDMGNRGRNHYAWAYIRFVRIICS